MSPAASDPVLSEADAHLRSSTPPRVEADFVGRVRRAMAERDQCVAVIDDDPTGTQTVQDVPVLFGWSEDDLLEVVRDPARVFFVLTNSRSLAEAEAEAVNEELGALLASISRKARVDLRIVSRSDSTLRGHFPAETDALARGWMAGGGEPIDGVLLCPHFFEAGRIVGDNILWVKNGEDLVPAAQTEFAADPVFGYRNSDLLHWVTEKSGGSPMQTVSVGLDDLRSGGPRQVGRLLGDLSPGSIVAVNAADYADLEVFVLGLLKAEGAGKRFLYRTGPSFVGVRSANRGGAPLTYNSIYEGGEREGHGLVVVGSHTGLTTRQVRRASEELGLHYVELDTRALLDERRDPELFRAGSLIERKLLSRDVIVATGREMLSAGDKDAGLVQGRRISEALVELVGALDPGLPIRYLVAKGGITSYDVAARGLKVTRARVVGQMRRGMVSVWRLDDESLRPGLPYVVFPGNVGNDDTLLEVLETLRGEA